MLKTNVLDDRRDPPGATPLWIQYCIIDLFAIILLGSVLEIGNDLKPYIEIFKARETKARNMFF